MAFWYARATGKNRINDFNEGNTLGVSKLLLYPFFTCIANGSFDKLYDLFGPFYALEDGPTSMTALNLSIGGGMRQFEIDRVLYNLKIKDTGHDWGYIGEQINGAALPTIEGGVVRFDHVVYDQSDKLVTASIDSSIKAIEKQSDGKFILFDDYQIITLARQHRSWSTIFSYYKAYAAKSLQDLEIPKAEAEKDRKVFRSSEEFETGLEYA